MRSFHLTEPRWRNYWFETRRKLTVVPWQCWKGAGAPRLSRRIAQTPQLIRFQSGSIAFMKLNISASETQRSMGRRETSRRPDTSPAWWQILLLADIFRDIFIKNTIKCNNLNLLTGLFCSVEQPLRLGRTQSSNLSFVQQNLPVKVCVCDFPTRQSSSHFAFSAFD